MRIMIIIISRQIGVFPKQTDDGHAIMFHRLQDTCYSNYQMDVAMKILFMTLDITTYERPPKGLIILFDMKGVSFKIMITNYIWSKSLTFIS